EQAKRPALAVLQQLDDFISGFCGKPRVTHIQHFPRQIQQRLARIIEFRWQLAFLGLIESKPLLDVVEAHDYRQRRRSENYGVELFEQSLAQSLAHVNWRCRHESSFLTSFVSMQH